MLILKAFHSGRCMATVFLLRIQQISGDRLEIQQGSLYPALYRLEHQGSSTASGGNPKTTERRSITNSPPPDGASFRKNR